MAVNEAYNYREINEHLSLSGVINEEQLASLSAEGYGALINLLPEENEYSVSTERDIVQQQGLDYTYIPVDFNQPSIKQFQAFADALDRCKNKRTIVHCAANYRVSAFYAIYAYKNLGWTRQQALDFIGSIWVTADYPRWQEFIDAQLLE